MNAEGFSVRKTGNTGLEIVSPTGTVIAWATSELVGCLIAKLLNGFVNAPELVSGETRMNELNETERINRLLLEAASLVDEQEQEEQMNYLLVGQDKQPTKDKNGKIHNDERDWERDRIDESSGWQAAQTAWLENEQRLSHK